MDSFKEIIFIALATPIYAITILVELIVSHVRLKKVYSLRGLMENVLLSVLNMAVDITMRGIALGALVWGYEHQWLDWEIGFAYWLSLLIAEDFLYYWLHWSDHRCRILWAVHVTHHSSDEFNLSVGFRSSVFQPIYRFIFFLPLALIGFKPEDIFLMFSLTQIYGILLHTQLVGKLGIVEYLLVTPSHHRVHHASNAQYLDKNLGMVFILWDKLFGTFAEECEPVRYGITKPFIKRHVLDVIFSEWRSIAKDVSKEKSINRKIRCLFFPPG